MTHGGLFSGIGGFELAAQWAGIENKWSVEQDKFACMVLRKNFKHKIIENDIRQLSARSFPGVDIISGGEPCQPHSLAGLGKGQADDRYLWPEMFRIIREIHPTWVVNENVTGTVSNGVLDIKISHLENEGYTCQAFIIPASAVGALHQRERVWLIAHDTNSTSKHRQSKNKEEKKTSEKICELKKPVDLWSVATNTGTERREERNNASEPDLQEEGMSRYFGFGPSPYGHIPRDEIKAAIIRSLHGVSGELDECMRSKSIKALGNAIVPQIAYEIFKMIKEIS